ncbi:MAG TPA: MerR family transcriptional regulator, partial [Thermomicrobiales bacterium]|nr:MerR family transcriptional regulator [Thermomicrobiales bacterium]
APRDERATYTIGALSKRTGVPVRTIRFYSDEGVLPPSEVTDAGYRRYTATDLLRLETIRTLRAAGFDLATIRGLLAGEIDDRRAVELQLRALTVQERLVRRQRRVLERVLEGRDLNAYPERVRALALVSAAERSSFLRRHLEDGLEGVPVDPSWLAGFLDAAVDDLPEDLSDEQLAAWVELAEMVADPSFAEAMRREAEPFWAGVSEGDAFDFEAYRRDVATITDQAKTAMRAGAAPDSDEARGVVDAWLALTAGSMGRAGDDDFARWMAEHARRHDPRLGRYWELVGTLKGWQVDRELNAAWEWLFAALEHRVRERAET